VILLIASGDVIVPAVLGMPEEQALAQLRAAGFQVTTRHAPRSNVPAGQTASTEPPPGAGAPAGTVVLLTISQGP